MPVRATRRPAKEYPANLPLFREVSSRLMRANPGNFAASKEVKEEDDMNVDRRHAIFDGNANSEGVDRRAYQKPAPRPRWLS
jgi:hypothetical protein